MRAADRFSFRARRYLPAYSTARRTGGCKWYIHYYPQSNGWNLLGDKLLRPPTLLAEFRVSIRTEAERDTFWGCLSSPSRRSPASSYSRWSLIPSFLLLHCGAFLFLGGRGLPRRRPPWFSTPPVHHFKTWAYNQDSLRKEVKPRARQRKPTFHRLYTWQRINDDNRECFRVLFLTRC